MTTLITETSAAETTAPPPTNFQVAAEKMYPPAAPPARDVAPNAAVQAVRNADGIARQMYPDSMQYGKDGGAVRGLALAINPEASAAQLSAMTTSLAAVAVDCGMSRSDVAELAGVCERFAANPPTEEARAAFRRTAVKEMRQEYGQNFDEVLADAKKLASRDPRLAKLLSVSGAGDDPRVIKKFAELARIQRARGLLKDAS